MYLFYIFKIRKKRVCFYVGKHIFAFFATCLRKVVYFAKNWQLVYWVLQKNEKYMVSNDASSLQSQFLRGIEDIIPATSSLVNELSDVLEISTDSAYRRMRGETLLTIDEIILLCEHFRISFDAFSKVKTGMVTFSYSPLEPNAEHFAQYLDNMLKDITVIASAKESSIVYACQDIPVFHHYNYPDLANFKIFYWMRTIMNLPDLNRIKYDADFQFTELLDVAKKIFDTYSRIPSVELWTESTVLSTLKQIGFYWDSGIFDSKEDALRVCAALSKEVEDIQQMAEVSSKLPEDQNITQTSGEEQDDGREQVKSNFKLYVSDIELTNNCVLVNIGNIQAVHLGHFSFSNMTTKNETYCRKTESWLNNIIKKSTLISGVSEKQRFQFFQNVNREIDGLMKRINEK